MENSQRPDKSTGAGLRNRRPIIGCLTAMTGLGNDISQAFWSGVTDIAQKRDVNLICFAGGWLSDPRGFRAQANVLYELVNVENVGGVVSWGTSIGSYTGVDELVAFHERYRPLPVVIAGGKLEGFPSLLLDSYTSMRAAIVHLIEAHGYRRLAFIRGPEDSFHAQERYRAYVETLEAHGLPVDPRLITQPLPWDHTTGREAMRLLLDERGLRPHTDFDAIVGASDELLLGALDVLQTRGVRVPGDVAAVGFDDSAEGKAHTPPFTSVASPHYEMGYRAVEMLLSLMESGQVAGEALVPELVIRQSCGCLDPAVVQAAVDPGEVRGETFESFLASRREQAFSAMAQAIGESYRSVASGWEERLLESFASELKGGAPGLFLQELGEVLRQAMAAGGDVSAWQGAVSALRRQIVLYLDGKMLRQAENLWQQARVMIGETAQRAQAYHALQAARQARTLREIETALLTTFDVAGLMDGLAQNLPRLGIPSCYLALYEDPQPYGYPRPAPEWSRLVLAYTEQGRVELEPGGRRFRSCELVPEGVLLQERQYNLVVEPLYFQENQLGFVLLEAGPREGVVYETLRTQISSALQGTLLTEQVARRALQLQTAAEVSRAATDLLDLSTLLQQVVELVQKRFDLYYVGLFLMQGADSPSGESAPDGPSGPSAWAVLWEASGEAARQMLAQGHRLKVGGKSMIGQCIADHRPRIALDVGEEAVRFDNPLLPETHSEMALPLVTREGAIGALSVQSRERGAFGEAEVAVFETLAGQLANAIASARLYDQALQEILERRRVEGTLRQRTLELEARNAELDAFAHTVAHDLKNPLSTLILLSTMLEARFEEMASEEVEDTLQRVSQTGYRLANITDELLLLSSVRKEDVQLEPLDMASIVAEAQKRLADILAEYRAEVSGAAEWPVALGYAPWVEEIWVNYINNAVKYGGRPEQGVPPRVELGFDAPINAYVRFWVRDNGPGLVPEEQARLFAPFTRLHQVRAEGHGLGLSIVQRIVGKLGGEVGVESQMGEGSLFYFTLPVAAAVQRGAGAEE